MYWHVLNCKWPTVMPCLALGCTPQEQISGVTLQCRGIQSSLFYGFSKVVGKLCHQNLGFQPSLRHRWVL